MGSAGACSVFGTRSLWVVEVSVDTCGVAMGMDRGVSVQALGSLFLDSGVVSMVFGLAWVGSIRVLGDDWAFGDMSVMLFVVRVSVSELLASWQEMVPARSQTGTLVFVFVEVSGFWAASSGSDTVFKVASSLDESGGVSFWHDTLVLP